MENQPSKVAEVASTKKINLKFIAMLIGYFVVFGLGYASSLIIRKSEKISTSTVTQTTLSQKQDIVSTGNAWSKLSKIDKCMNSLSTWKIDNGTIICRPNTCGDDCPIKETAVFTNAGNVADVRLDNGALHFQYTNNNETEAVWPRCLTYTFDDKAGNSPYDLGQARSGSFGFHDCGTGDESGFLKSSNYFVYADIENKTILVQDLSKGKLIEISATTSKNFAHDVASLNEYPALVGGYAYPQYDLIDGNYLYLGFRELILVIDLNKKIIVGSYSLKYPVVINMPDSTPVMSKDAERNVIVSLGWPDPSEVKITMENDVPKFTVTKK